MVDSEKTRENRLRRVARRQGYQLVRSRTRDPHATDHGLYAVINPAINGAVNPASANGRLCSWTLDTVEEWLDRPIRELDDLSTYKKRPVKLSDVKKGPFDLSDVKKGRR
jgi:hypothetical protein